MPKRSPTPPVLMARATSPHAQTHLVSFQIWDGWRAPFSRLLWILLPNREDPVPRVAAPLQKPGRLCPSLLTQKPRYTCEWARAPWRGGVWDRAPGCSMSDPVPSRAGGSPPCPHLPEAGDPVGMWLLSLPIQQLHHQLHPPQQEHTALPTQLPPGPQSQA